MKVTFVALTILILLNQIHSWNLQGACYGESPRDLKRRYQILKDVPNIPKLGLPGEVVVFGQNASVIVVGDDKRDVLIGASELGKGRIVAMAHDAYITDFSTGNNSNPNIAKLQTNIKKWVKRLGKESSPKFTVMKAQDYINQVGLNPSTGPILFTDELKMDKLFTQEQKNRIVDYVKNGGSLVVSVCPWGWASIKGSNDNSLMLTYKTLAQAGLTFSSQYIWQSPTFVTDNPTAYLSHIGKQIDLVFDYASGNVNYSIAEHLSFQGRYIPQQYKKNLKNQIENFQIQKQIAAFTPTVTNKVSSPYLKAKSSLYLHFVLNAGVKGIVAPGFDKFPGAVNKSSPAYKLTSKSFSFVPRGNFAEFYHTGYYAVAGQTVVIQITGIKPKNNWQINIGFHPDEINLYIKDNSWQRWPFIYKKQLLSSTKLTITSPFGGLIYFQSPQSSVQTLNVKLTNIIQAPYFNTQDSANVADWSRRINSLAPWGLVEGKWVGFHMPINALKTLDKNKLVSVLNLYDKIMESYHSLRGTKPNSERRQYVSCDLQISIGYMHSGYPIGTFLDVADPNFNEFLLNETTLRKTGIWGIYHELGHNVQQDWWTYQGTGEVTNNIFTLRGIATSTGNQNPLNSQWVRDQLPNAKLYLNDKNQGYSKWKSDPGIALLIYVQIIADYGWSVFQKVFASYQTDKSYPNSDQQKIDTFWAKVSITANADMTPLLTKWKIPFTSAFTNKVNKLPKYVQKVDMLKGI